VGQGLECRPAGGVPLPTAAPPASAVVQSAAEPVTWGGMEWADQAQTQARTLLAQGMNGVWDHMVQQLEAKLIGAALEVTHGRRVEAANRLGIGRNTITRKIQELGLD